MAEKKAAPRKRAVKKVVEVKLRAIVRVNHNGVTYEVGDIIMEKDPEMVKQLLGKSLAEKV